MLLVTVSRGHATEEALSASFHCSSIYFCRCRSCCPLGHYHHLRHTPWHPAPIPGINHCVVCGGVSEIQPLPRKLPVRSSRPYVEPRTPEPQDAAPQNAVAEQFYDWQFGFRVRYFQSGTSGPPILLIHGFGVGAYHYERNIAGLAERHRVFALDLVGQGSSWPQRDPEQEEKLYYSIDTWTSQIEHFIETYIGEPAYIVGNSLGGFLALNVAQRPDLCKGLILLNATPYWAFQPALTDNRGLWGLLPLPDGSIPVPQVGSSRSAVFCVVRSTIACLTTAFRAHAAASLPNSGCSQQRISLKLRYIAVFSDRGRPRVRTPRTVPTI